MPMSTQSVPARPASLSTLWLLILVTAVGFLIAPQLILRAPTEPTMGFVQRIFYFHVPCCWLAMLGALTCGVCSALYLFKHSEKAEQYAASAAELTVVFG